MDSKPKASACHATSRVRDHASFADQPLYSPVQPCGTMTPIFIDELPELRRYNDFQCSRPCCEFPVPERWAVTFQREIRMVKIRQVDVTMLDKPKSAARSRELSPK